MSDQLHVLVVDPSALVRESVTTRLQRCGWIRVSTAPDTAVAIAKLRVLRPAVMLLALDHAVEAALAFLHERMGRTPLPILVHGRDTEAIVRALALGAADVVPAHLVNGPASSAADRELIARLTAASRARPSRDAPAPEQTARRDDVTPRTAGQQSLVAIGASTGGTAAVLQVLRELPLDAPPVAIVIHMPPEFTGAFARHLDKECRIAVREARHGDRLERGLALVAPGDQHLEVMRARSGFCVSLHDGPPVSGHRPSVDVLLHSVARSCGPSATGVVLTGMGRDGAEGLLALRDAGGATVVQDEASSVVFGMAREAIRLGAADRVLPLPRIGGVLVQRR